MNLRPAPDSIVLALKRRLEKHNPGAQLIADSVKLCPIPGTPYDATLFIFVAPGGSKRVFTAEIGADRADTPHIYEAHCLPPDDNGQEIAKIMAKSLLGLAHTISTDPRFRPRIITLNGHRPSGLSLVTNASPARTHSSLSP